MKPTNWQIRRVRPGDIEGVIQIDERSFPNPWSRIQFQIRMEDSGTLFLVAEGDRELLGYAILREIASEAEIYNIAVTPEARRASIGTALLDYIVEYGKDNGLVGLNLEVRSGNLPAIGMYKKRGFERVGLRKGYYSMPKEDAVLMTYYYAEEMNR